MKTRIQRSGRVLSAASEAHLRKAIGHCQQSIAYCEKSIALIQEVLDSNTKVAARRLVERQWSHAIN